MARSKVTGHVPTEPLKAPRLVGITPTEPSQQIGVPPNRTSQIIQGKRAIAGDTALRLGHWFKRNAEFWLNLQTAYDLRRASKEVGRTIAKLPTRPARRVAT